MAEFRPTQPYPPIPAGSGWGPPSGSGPGHTLQAAAAGKHPAIAVISAAGTSVFAALGLIYLIIVLIVLQAKGFELSFLSRLGRMDAAASFTIVLVGLGTPLFLVLALAAALSLRFGAARIAAGVLLLLGIGVMLGFFGLYVLTPARHLGIPLALWVISFVYPLILVVAGVCLTVTYFFGWRRVSPPPVRYP